MKTTVWLWPVITTLLCANQLVCTAQRQYLDFADWNGIGDDYVLEKRTKPSLSIVNPLDVLRQRLLLEIARRQMRENTKQVEINRAILKNVGKRSNSRDFLDFLRQVPIENSNDLEDINRNNMNIKNIENDPKEDYYNIMDNNNHQKNPNNNNHQQNPNNNHNNDNNDDYQIRYLYSLHKNRFPNK